MALSWSAPAHTGGSTITGYKVYRGTASGGETSLTTVAGTTYTDSAAANGTTYYYYVTAVYSGGESQASNEVSATPSGKPVAPTLNSATAGANQVTLSWTPGSNGGSAITGYKIYRSTSSGTETLIASPAGTGTTYTDTTAVNGSTYYYKVSAVNANGEGSLSNEVSVTLANVPGAPTITKVSRHSGSSTSVDVTFTAPSSNGGAAITQYIVKCSSGSPTACSSTTVSAGSSPQTVTVTGLTQGKYYTFVVDAVNSAGPGPDSNVSQAVTPNPTTPARVSRLSVHRQGHVVTFRWHVAIPSGIVGFNLYAGKSRINSHVIASHTGRDYTARVSTAHSGPYRLGVILSSGKVISVRGK